MNIADRARLYCLYSEIRRVPSPGGRLATYDIVLRAGDVIYPTSWAGDGSASFLMSEDETPGVHPAHSARRSSTGQSLNR